MSEAQQSGHTATPVSPLSVVSSLRGDEEQAVRMQRVHHPAAGHVYSPITSPMTPWLRKAVAEKKCQLAASRALASPDPGRDNEYEILVPHRASKLTEQHFGFSADSRFESQNFLVSEWLQGLPERLTEGWETVLRKEVRESWGSRRRRSKMKSRRLSLVRGPYHSDEDEGERRQTFFEEQSGELEYCPVIDLEEDIQDGEPGIDEECGTDGGFLLKVLLGRKRVMQAEISVKRLKMGLKHVTSGVCTDLSNAADIERTRELLDQVDSTYENVVRKRLSNVTAILEKADHNDEQKQMHRRRLETMRNKDPGFILRVYNEREIRELKTMVADVLGMDERSGTGEGTDWFWDMLPRLLELRGDIAEAEKEMQRQRRAAKTSNKSNRQSFVHGTTFVRSPLSVWDLYYHQYIWMQSELYFRPIGSWYAFSIPVEDEAKTEDWELRIEQRVWLQEHFALSFGTRRWRPFRQAMIPADWVGI